MPVWKDGPSRLKSHAKRKLQRPWIGHRGNLLERRRWIGRIRAGAERAVQSHAVDMIEQIERLRNTFQPQPLADGKSPAQPRVHVEEIEAASRVAVDEYAVDGGTGGCALDRGGAGGNVERQRRVVLQHSAQLKPVALDCAVENQAMPLVVVGPPVIPPDIEIVDRGAKEELADVV